MLPRKKISHLTKIKRNNIQKPTEIRLYFLLINSLKSVLSIITESTRNITNQRAAYRAQRGTRTTKLLPTCHKNQNFTQIVPKNQDFSFHSLQCNQPTKGSFNYLKKTAYNNQASNFNSPFQI